MFIETGFEDDKHEFRSKVNSLLPTLAEHGIMIKANDGKYMFTEKGGEAFFYLMHRLIIEDCVGVDQGSVLESCGLLRFRDKDEYMITKKGIYATLSYLIQYEITNEDIIGIIKEYWVQCYECDDSCYWRIKEWGLDYESNYV